MDLGLSNRTALAFGAADGLGGATKPVLAGAEKLAATETHPRAACQGPHPCGSLEDLRPCLSVESSRWK
jgi:hypothetical protein